jgi:hypothetical protein
MDAARIGEFTQYDVDVFASFVADLWERAGYDCVVVDSVARGRAHAVIRPHNRAASPARLRRPAKGRMLSVVH